MKALLLTTIFIFVAILCTSQAEINNTDSIIRGDYKERVYILHIFQLAFSSQEKRRQVYLQMQNWEEQKQHFPQDINEFDWRSFQQEYRDYIDLAKLAQMIPFIGAAVGLVVNYKLLEKLGKTAMNAYRMRLLDTNKLPDMRKFSSY